MLFGVRGRVDLRAGEDEVGEGEGLKDRLGMVGYSVEFFCFVVNKNM